MNEKEIRREMRICKFGAWTAVIGAFVPLTGAIIMVAFVDAVAEKFDLPGALVMLAMSLLFLVLALGGAIFALNHRQSENSLRLLELAVAAKH